ncbi:NACHT domain-containing protein [Flavobacterium terrisoli]|uniref:NACHT domain-containing protein n=1 Tax=Flavobacterium terrisoli TaxID=3242195 RepID=UPI0025437645|nr:hypothetical protein [Flavobacterium buctense]
MTSQGKGKSFEILTEEFFLSLFEQLKIQVNNNWIQKAGYQYGFDVGFEVAILKDDIFKRGIFIECKNYEKSILEQSQLHTKLLQFDRSDYEKRNSIFIFLSPKIDLSKCTQDSNPKQLEDYFNRKSDFKTLILTPNNNIKDILSLEKEIFTKVYGDDLFIEPDEESKNKIFEYFNILLFSKGEIPNFSEVSQREIYLKEASIVDNDVLYIKRALKRNKFSFFQDDKSLLELIKDENIILLLGEPGSGKTTELINLSKYFEKNISDLGVTPIFINLSNKDRFEDISDLMPVDWKANNRIVILLDGFDEFEFKSVLSEQIKRLLENKEISFKIVISCRTYAYNEELSQLEPAKFYLDGFTTAQSMKLLNGKFGLPVEVYDKIEKDKFKDILEDPFMLNLLGIYYTSHNIIPDSVFEIYENIKGGMPADEIEMYKIFALILELTKNTSIEKAELRSLFGLGYNKLINLKFIQKSFDKRSFKFIHKNYQEYFAALALSELSYDRIIDFIVIKGTNKTHQSLFNTITFLINIVEIDKYNLLVEWLKANDRELLFKADKNRIENIRVEIFREYFETECIDKTFWITNNKTLTVKEIADFGDCVENFDYLNRIVNNDKNHYRVIISALELLSFFTVPLDRRDDFKQELLCLLKSESISDAIKAHVVSCINDQMFCDEDIEYLHKIFEIFKAETSKQINIELLSLLKDYKPIDDFFWYIKDEFLRDKRILPRVEKDDVMRGNSWKLEKLIIRLKSSSNFIFFAKFYFDETTNSYTDNRFAEDIIEKCLFFESEESDFLVRLLSSFEDKEKYYLRETLLKALILKSSINSQIESFKYLIENFTFNNVGYFLASITTEKTINIVIDKFKDGSLDSDNLDFFRNVIANHGNRKLAGEFNSIMIENEFTFKHDFLLEREFEEQKMEFENKPQDNFDKLFNKPQLLSEIQVIFGEYGNSVKPERMREIDMAWYEKNGHGNRIDIAYSLLSRLVYKEKREITYDDVVEILNEEFIIIKEIKSKIEGSDKIKVKEEQKEFLCQWCLEVSKDIDFNKIMKRIDDSRFSLLKDYERLKTVLFFMIELDINLPQQFMLDSIEFFDVDKSNVEDNNLDILKGRIKNIDVFNQRIVENLLNKQLVFFSLNKHIQYALDNSLVETFSKIRECFLIDGLIYNSDSQLSQYIKLTSDTDLLVELCIDVKSHVCWSSIKILMDLGIHKELCIEKAIEYLELEMDDEKRYYYSNALAILFESNSLEALKYLEYFLNIDSVPSLKESSFANYDIIEDYNILEELFNKIYLEDRNKIGFSGVSNFLKIYISNLARTTEGYEKIIAKLNEIKNKIVNIETDNGLFYINLLIDDCRDNYINSKSKALNFDDALTKIEEILS